MCIFEGDTVKRDCPVQIFEKNYEIFQDLIQTVGLPYLFYCFFLEILKKNALKMTSQLVIFRAFFSFFCFIPPTLNLKKFL